MHESERLIYEKAAENCARGMSANESMKSLCADYASWAAEPARKGYADMRTYLAMRRIEEEVARQQVASNLPKTAVPV